MMNSQDVLDLIAADPWMMAILRSARQLELPDWWIGAGFVRSKVWDHLHGYTERTLIPDIDVIYFDPTDSDESIEKVYQEKLETILPDIGWSVKNMARMHLLNNEPPYHSAIDGLSHWVETPTCVAVKLDDNDQLQLAAPHGIEDLVNLVVRPSPGFSRDISIYRRRVAKKQWQQRWPKLKILDLN